MKHKKIFFVGIKGVGMAGLALISKQAHFSVAGSDTDEEFITDKFLRESNIPIYNGFKSEDIRTFLTPEDKNSFVIATAAHSGMNNPQVLTARSLGIPCMTYGQALGEFMSGKIFGRELTGISIAGSHGKTTITGLCATSLIKLNLDPSYVIGTGEIFPLGEAGHYGQGNHFISEADEYASDPVSDRVPKFLYQKPTFAIINNIDFDHPDFFKDLHDVENAFLAFAQNVSEQGVLIVNGDYGNIHSLISQIDNTKIITYGASEKNDFYFSKYSESGLTSFFHVESHGISLGEFHISIPGYHNAKNALSVIALLIELGIPVEKIQHVLPLFTGAKRRFEVVGKTRYDSIIIDDYAHHPQEIRTTLLAVQKAFPGKKIICIFQPHTFSRTEALLSEFAAAFGEVDTLIVLPTYASARENSINKSQEDLLETEFKKTYSNVLFMNQSSVIEYIEKLAPDSRSVIVTMGAGDIYKVNEKLKVKIEK